MDMFNELFDGDMDGAKIINGTDWNEDTGMVTHLGKNWDVCTEVGDIDTFLASRDLSNLTLYRSDGDRGEGCYSGWYENDGQMYWLDINNEYVVYKMEEVNWS